MSRKPAAFDAISIPEPCPADWQAMTGNRRTRFCQQCNRYVYNLSAMSRDDAEALVARFEGRLCARFERDTDGVILTADLQAAPQLIGRRVSPVAAAIVTAIIGLSGNAMAVTARASAPAAVHAHSGRDDRAPQPQGDTTTLAGVVKDSQDAVIPGVKVTLIDEAGGEPVAATTSDGEGAFSFTSLAEGTYTLFVVSPGFAPLRETGIVIRAGETARLDLTLVVRAVSLGGVVAIQPQPLRSLHHESDLIIVGRVGRSVPVKSAESNEMMKTTLEVTSVVKGYNRSSKVTVYNWGWGEDKQFPGGLKTGDAALFFLKRREADNGFEVSDYSYGVKKLAPADLSVYLERLNELNAMAKAGKADNAAIVEWLVRCAEQRATRWEGAFELARSVEDDEDEPDDAQATDESEAADDTAATIQSVATVDPTQLAEKTGADSTCSKADDQARFAAMLSDAQKDRLQTALFNLDALAEQDMELVELVRHWKAERLVPFLLDQLRRVESNPPPLAQQVMQVVAESLGDEDLKSLADAYSNQASYADLEAEDASAAGESVDHAAEREAGQAADEPSSDEASEKVKDAATARQERSQMLRHFVTLAEKKRAQ